MPGLERIHHSSLPRGWTTPAPSRTSLLGLAGVFDARVHDPSVPREGVAAGKGLLYRAQGALDLDLGPVMHRLLMPREIVGSREVGVAGLIGGRVELGTFVWTGLVVPVGGSATTAAVVAVAGGRGGGGGGGVGARFAGGTRR